MNDAFTLAGACLGVLSVVVYIFIARKRATEPDLADAISLILSGIGLLMGVKVCWFALVFRDTPPIKEISTQTFIGGIAVAWVAIANALKKFRF